MKKNVIVYVDDIIESMNYIINDLKDVSFKKFEIERKLQDSVLYRFMIIGEAANKISKETQKRFFQIPWSNIISMRNVLIHEYSGVDIELVFDTAKADLPPTRDKFLELKVNLNKN